MHKTPYIGRFAPSPTGPLHLGSLTSAMCSYLQAKSQQGQWRVRIEDIDTPRIVKGSSDIQLKQLETFGFEWDGSILYQSDRTEIYQHAVSSLLTQDLAYYCECTRKTLSNTAKRSEVGIIYPRYCRSKHLASIPRLSTRFKTSDTAISFHDAVYAEQNFNIQELTSDWVMQRADKVIAYHLAVVLDDQYQNISEVVRGVDLLPLTALHIDLQEKLKITQPSYFHHPLIIQHNQKMSKQNLAISISEMNIPSALNLALTALGQQSIEFHHLKDFWSQAIQNWRPKLIPKDNYRIKELSD